MPATSVPRVVAGAVVRSRRFAPDSVETPTKSNPTSTARRRSRDELKKKNTRHGTRSCAAVIVLQTSRCTRRFFSKSVVSSYRRAVGFRLKRNPGKTVAAASYWTGVYNTRTSQDTPADNTVREHTRGGLRPRATEIVAPTNNNNNNNNDLCEEFCVIRYPFTDIEQRLLFPSGQDFISEKKHTS